MNPVKCFMLEESGRMKRYLRRYHDACPAPWRFLNGMEFLDEVPHKPNTYISSEVDPITVPYDDPRWPLVCDCGYVFDDSDYWQIFTDTIYRRTDTGEEMTVRDAPPGAMWNAWWMADIDHYRGPDGKCLVVKCPPDGWEWTIDGPASNCNQKDRPHKCWVRTGTPPNITVGKGKPGESCTAGAGSILTPKWHGFLQNGCLV